MVFFNFILNYKKHYENLLLFYDFLNVFQTEQKKLSEKIEKFSKIKEIDDNSDYDYLYDFSNTFKSIIEQNREGKILIGLSKSNDVFDFINNKSINDLNFYKFIDEDLIDSNTIDFFINYKNFFLKFENIKDEYDIIKKINI